MFSQILDSIKTKEDLLTLQSEMNSVKDGLYSKKPLEEVLYNNVRKKTAELVTAELDKAENKKKEIESILEKMNRFEIINITLAYEPTQEDVDSVYEELKGSLKDFVVNLSFNPDIVAGSVIHYKGEYRDYSLKKKLESQIESALNLKNDAVNEQTRVAKSSDPAKVISEA